MPKLELVGKIVRAEIKDFGKGKDAEAREVLVMTAKLDSKDGVRGSLSFAPGDRADDFQLGGHIACLVDVRQGELKLERGRRAAAEE